MASVHTKEDIEAVCDKLLDSGVNPTRTRVKSELRERAVQMGLPAAGAANALIDRAVSETIAARRAAADAPTSDPDLGALELPVALTECMSRSGDIVARIYREGVAQATREVESIWRRVVEAAEVEARARETALRNEIEHSVQERADLASDLDAAIFKLQAAEDRTRDIQAELSSARSAFMELRQNTDDRIVRLEEDVRVAHSSNAAAERARVEAELSRQTLSDELSNLKGTYEAIESVCKRAEDRAFALNAALADCRAQLSSASEQLSSSRASLSASVAECARLREENATLARCVAVVEQMRASGEGRVAA